MKRFALFALLLVSAVALFAAPATEAEDADDNTPGYGRGLGGPFGMGFAGDEDVWNPVEITGTVEIVDGHPVIVSDGKTYLIGAPMVMMYADEVEEGTEIVVRGQLVEDLSNDIVEFMVDGHIMVEQVEIDGEVLSLDRFGGPMGGGRYSRFDDRRWSDDDFARGSRGDRMPRGRW